MTREEFIGKVVNRQRWFAMKLAHTRDASVVC